MASSPITMIMTHINFWFTDHQENGGRTKERDAALVRMAQSAPQNRSRRPVMAGNLWEETNVSDEVQNQGKYGN